MSNGWKGNERVTRNTRKGERRRINRREAERGKEVEEQIENSTSKIRKINVKERRNENKSATR